MSITPGGIVGWGTEDVHSAATVQAVVGNNSVEGHPDPNHADEEFTSTWDNSGIPGAYGNIPGNLISSASTWQTYGLKARWSDFGTLGATDFAFMSNQVGSVQQQPTWILRWDKDGDLSITDGTSTEIARDSGVLSLDKEYYFLVEWRTNGVSTNGDIYVWYWEADETGDGVRHVLLVDTDFNHNETRTLEFAWFLIGGGIDTLTHRGYVGSGFFVNDDGANWDTNNTTNHGDLSNDQTIAQWFVPRLLPDKTGKTPDAGDDLDTGVWPFLEVPEDIADPSSAARMLASFRSGDVYTDDSSEGGPSGRGWPRDPAIALWIFAYQAEGISKSFPPVILRYGNSTDGALVESRPKSTSVNYKSFIEGYDSTNAGHVPTNSQIGLLGFGSGSASGANSAVLLWHSMEVLIIEDAPIASALIDIIGVGVVPFPR